MGSKRMILCECKSPRAGFFQTVLMGGIARGIGAAIIIGGLTGAVITLIAKTASKKAGMMRHEGQGAYGAVAVAKIFKGADFPLSKHDIMQKYGDREIEYHLGRKEKLRDILRDVPDQTFNRTTALEHALHEMMEQRKEHNF